MIVLRKWQINIISVICVETYGSGVGIVLHIKTSIIFVEALGNQMRIIVRLVLFGNGELV